MLRLMQQCDRVDRNHDFSKRKASNVAALYDRNGETEESESNVNIQSDAPAPVAHEEETNPKGLLAGNPFSVFSGVFPGTKWCGTGDIAKNYHDLGTVRTFKVSLNFLLIVSFFLSSGKEHRPVLPGPRHLSCEDSRLSVAIQSHQRLNLHQIALHLRRSLVPVPESYEFLDIPIDGDNLFQSCPSALHR